MIGEYTISPDGRHMINRNVVSATGLWRIDLDTESGTWSTPTQVVNAETGHLEWSPSGTHVVYYSMGSRYAVKDVLRATAQATDATNLTADRSTACYPLRRVSNAEAPD